MRPFDSKALGNFVDAQAKALLEGSNGYESFDVGEFVSWATNAMIILSQLQQKFPDTFDRVNSVTMVDASSSLFELQVQTI